MLLRKKYSLSIPEPCHESWQQMQPLEQGRYCKSCHKAVTDFTVMSEKEIADFFKHQPQHVCGRFTDTQLQKTYTASAVNVLPLYKRVSRYLIGFLLTGAALEKAHAQEPAKAFVQNDSLLKDSGLAMVPLIPDSLATQDTCSSTAQADPVADDSLRICWEPSVSFPAITYTVDISTITITSGAICIVPPEPQRPLDVMIDSLGRLLRNMRLKKAADHLSKTEALSPTPPDKSHAPNKAPVKLPAQEAIASAALEWKSRNKRSKKM